MGRMVLVGAGLLALWIAKLVMTEIVKREYDSWAPSLARAVVHIGSRLYPGRADEWQAELAHVQADGTSGLDYAVTIAVAGSRFAVRKRLRAVPLVGPNRPIHRERIFLIDGVWVRAIYSRWDDGSKIVLRIGKPMECPGPLAMSEAWRIVDDDLRSWPRCRLRTIVAMRALRTARRTRSGLWRATRRLTTHRT